MVIADCFCLVQSDNTERVLKQLPDKLRVVNLNGTWPIPTIELGPDYVTAFFRQDPPDIANLIYHDPPRFHADSWDTNMAVYWVNEYFGEDAYKKGYFQNHLHAESLTPFSGLYDPALLKDI